MNIVLSAKRLCACIGEISDLILTEAEIADIAAEIAARKRKAKYGTIAACASVVVGMATFWIVRGRLAASQNKFDIVS